MHLPTVQENTLSAINVGNGALARSSGGKARIEGADASAAKSLKIQDKNEQPYSKYTQEDLIGLKDNRTRSF